MTKSSKLMMLGLALFATSTGCYGYSRTNPSQISPGSRVAVEVTPRLAAEKVDKRALKDRYARVWANARG